MDAVQGAQAKEFEAYILYDENYFVSCNEEMRHLRKFQFYFYDFRVSLAHI